MKGKKNYINYIYPPLSFQELNNKYKIAYNLPNSYKYSFTGLWLPSSLDLTIEELKYITDKIKEFFRLEREKV